MSYVENSRCGIFDEDDGLEPGRNRAISFTGEVLHVLDIHLRVSQYLPTVVFCMQTTGGDDPAHGVSVAGAKHVGSGRVKLNKVDVCVVGCAI